MRQAVNGFIMEVSNGDEVAIVEFSFSATELSDLTKITSEADRNDLLDEVPNDAAGGTCIGCGIQLAVEVRSMQ